MFPYITYQSSPKQASCRFRRGRQSAGSQHGSDEDDGGGIVIGSEIVAAKAEQARANLNEAGLAEFAARPR